MAGETKERILETALELFAQSGYLGHIHERYRRATGHSPRPLCISTMLASRKFWIGSYERMNELDDCPRRSIRNAGGGAGWLCGGVHAHADLDRIRAYSMAQFDHWTREPFSANFRKMLTLEQYRDPKLAQLHHDYLAGGPL